MKDVTVPLEVVAGSPREGVGLGQIRDVPREAARVVDLTTEPAEVAVLPPAARALTGLVAPRQAHRG